MMMAIVTTTWQVLQVLFMEEKITMAENCKSMTLHISGINEKFNIYVTLAIILRTKDINKAFCLVHIFHKTLSFLLLGRRISLLYHVNQKNLALLQFHIYSGPSINCSCKEVSNHPG